MPKGVRRNPFQALLDTASKQLQLARERLAAAEHHADCIHQKKLRAARVEHEEWARMVKSLNTSLTVVPPRPAPEPAAKKQSNNGAGTHPITAETPLEFPGEDPATLARQLIQTTPHLGGDAGDRRKQPGPHPTGRKPGRPGKVDRFDRCPGLPSRGRCLNSKPFDSELCGRCATMKNIPAVFQPK